MIQPDFERIVKTAHHEEPDRVPLCEVLIEYPIQSTFLGRTVEDDDFGAQVEFWTKAGYDYIPVTVGMMTPGKVTAESGITKVIKDFIAKDSGSTDTSSFNLEYNGLINTRKDYDRFPWEIAAQPDLNKLLAVHDMLPDGMKIIAVSGKIFTLAWMLMGFNNFAMSLILDETLVADIIRRIAKIQFQALEALFKMPRVGAVWVVDDIAGNMGPIISPQALRDHVFPWYKKMADECHKNDMLFFMHSDGDLMPVMEDLIDIGIDVLQPVDPTCMDIFRVKELYGSRICLVGNVSNELLQNGTPQEVDTTVRELIQKVAPGGGYCLGSGNSVTEWSRFENYCAMREAALKYGTYPLI